MQAFSMSLTQKFATEQSVSAAASFSSTGKNLIIHTSNITEDVQNAHMWPNFFPRFVITFSKKVMQNGREK